MVLCKFSAALNLRGDVPEKGNAYTVGIPDRHDRVNRIKDNRMRITIETNATLKFQPVSHTHSQKKEIEHVLAEPVVTTTRAPREGNASLRLIPRMHKR